MSITPAQPFDLDAEPLEAAAQRAARIFVEIYRGLESRRVAPPFSREQLRDSFANTLNEDGVGLLDALQEFERTVLPGSMGTPHPLYLGLVNSSPLPAAALADLLISALNNNGGAFHQSPAMSASEEEVVRSFVRLFRLPEAAGGMILPGGTFANLQALVLARSRAFGDGIQAGARCYASDASHFSVARSAKVAGVRAADVVSIPTVGRGTMDARALGDQITRDRRAGHQPFAVVATVGTTGTGAIDPVSEIAELCAREKVWLHVDACYGGGLALLPELEPHLSGVEKADSIAVDPHKWFFIPVTAGLLLIQDPKFAHDLFDTGSGSYVPTDGHSDPWQHGIPTTRRSSGFAVWMALRAHGWRTVREAVSRNIQLTRLLERLLAERGFSVLPDGELSIACARWEPQGVDPSALDQLQSRIAKDVVASGNAWFATVQHRGRTWLRFNLVNLYTRERHIRYLADLLAETAARIARSPQEGP